MIRKDLKPSVTKAIKNRDGGLCRKCGRPEPLQVHHIERGIDEPDNLITLCEACHNEWHMVEQSTHIDFGEWIALPTCTHLLIIFMQDWPATITAKEMQQSIRDTFAAWKSIR